MATYQPPKRGVEYIFYTSLVSQADAKLLKANPTLAAGDVVISKDGGAFANLTTLPTVTPAAGKGVKVTVSATEMTADNVLIIFSDAAGAEWCDLSVNVATSAQQIDDLATPAQVNTEVVDALNVDTYAEPGQGAPAATATLAAKINYLYKAWRNKKTQTSTTFSLFADDATTVDQKATVSDDATTATIGEIATGP